MRNASYHYFAIVDFGGHTRHAVWVLLAEIFGERSFVAFFPNKGDAGILLGKYFVKGFLEKSHLFAAFACNDEPEALLSIEVL